MNEKSRGWFVGCAAALLALGASCAHANFHLFRIKQLYSNADGTVQFVVLASLVDGEGVWTGHYISTFGAVGGKSFTFPNDLPDPGTAGKSVLVATQGFADLGIVAPDFVVPNHFLPTDGGTVDFAGVDSLSYVAGQLPNDGVNALFRDGSMAKNLATNFAGASGSVALGGPPGAANYQGLWWKSPGGSEDGWGINVAQQGEVIFGTWFTYDTTGKGWWLTLIADDKKTPGTYSGNLYAASGPPFNAVPFVQVGGPPPAIGEATLTFADANNGTFHYDVNLPAGKVSQTKTITRQLLNAAPLATCATQANLAGATNYQDIWWAGTSAKPGTESGWGINFTHQGDTLFASWFTYDLDGSPLWLVATGKKDAPGVFSGDLYRPSGPRFDAYDKGQFAANPSVGTLKLTFADGNNATFDYTVKLAGMAVATTQKKSITRQIFTAPGTTCK